MMSIFQKTVAFFLNFFRKVTFFFKPLLRGIFN